MGASYDAGNYNPPYATLGFRSGGPGAGGDPVGHTANLGGLHDMVANGPVTDGAAEFDFAVASELDPWFTLQAAAT